jgi:RNA polymerase sigma-54 factor
MKAGLNQSTQLKQELKVNPRLYQAMDLLYMPLLDLQQHLKQELLNNPFLDMVEPEEEDEEEGTESETEAQADEEPREKDDAIDWEEILLDGFDTGGRREEHEEKEYFEPVTVAERDLGDHLRDQITLLDLDPRQLMLAEEFLGNVNEDGYLDAPLDEILGNINDVLRESAEDRGMAPEDAPVFHARRGGRHAEDRAGARPAGRGRARPARVPDAPAPRRGARALGAVPPRPRLLRGAHRAPVERDQQALRHQPGRRAARGRRDREARPQAGTAVLVREGQLHHPGPRRREDRRQYHVFLNDANLPRLKLSKAYQEIARDKKKFDGESKEFISSKLNSANWMIQAIEQRRQTMLKVMNYIVDRQRDFFEKGVQFLKPLTLREVAEVINMHESTVSRVTNEKFVQTPAGVLPLKFFFSSGLSTTDGEDVSARGIKDQIQKLVQGEDAKNPLTDQAIVNILKKGGVNIARRTVAKYRDQLGVLSARMRKRV